MYITLFIVAATLGFIHAFPNGAHNNASNVMESLSSHCTAGHYRPNHGKNLPQHTMPPYNITLASPAGGFYKPGQAVSVTITGLGTQKFKGFFLFGDCTEGFFAGEITCTGQGHNVTYCGKQGATHSNALDKSEITCQWIPPDYQLGRVQFIATVVQNFDTFWTGALSTTHLDSDPTTMTYEQKTLQLRNLMLSQMGNMGNTGTGTGFAHMFQNQQGQANPFASFFRQS